MMLNQLGEVASSKSAIHTLAPEFSALMLILRLGGPVISHRRSSSPGAGGATRQRGIAADAGGLWQEVEVLASGDAPAALRGARPAARPGGRRARRRAWRRTPAPPGVRISSNRGCIVPLIVGGLRGVEHDVLLCGELGERWAALGQCRSRPD